MLLRLDSIELFHLRVPLQGPLRGDGAEIEFKEAIVVLVQTSRGPGWGEASMPLAPSGPPGASDACWEELSRRICPAALSQEETEVVTFGESLDRCSSMASAKAGLEMAVWHAAAMARDIPLCTLLGGFARPIPSGLVVGPCRSTDELVRYVERQLMHGYRCVKIEIRRGWDLQPVASVREQWPDLPLAVDARGGYTLEDLSTLRNLDKYSLSMIEQPMPPDALDDSARLQAILSTPICLSASVRNAGVVREIARKQAARIIGVNLQTVGGLGQAVRVHEAARKAGLGCRLCSTAELGISAAASLHLTTLDGFAHPADVGSSSRWFADDVLEPPIAIDAGGYLHLPDGPGYGYRPNRDKVEKHTLRNRVLTV